MRLEFLGRGKYGSTYRCIRQSDQKLFAAKVVHLPRDSEKARLKAKGEATSLGLCKHFGVVSMEEVLMTEKILILILEFCDHGDLKTVIIKRAEVSSITQTHRGFKEVEMALIIIQLALALRHIHDDRRLLHRDIKSANIFLMSNGLVKLGDFGFARTIADSPPSRNSSRMTFCGTPAYLAPEVWIKYCRFYNQKADIWSLGVVAYELVALKMPFPSEGLQQLKEEVLSGNVPVLPVSPECNAFLKSILTIDATLRPTAVQLFGPGTFLLKHSPNFLVWVEGLQLPQPLKEYIAYDLMKVVEKATNGNVPPELLAVASKFSGVPPATLPPIPAPVPGAPTVGDDLVVDGNLVLGTLGIYHKNEYPQVHVVLDGLNKLYYFPVSEYPSRAALPALIRDPKFQPRFILPVEDMDIATELSPEVAREAQNVFAIYTSIDASYWFQANSEAGRRAWIERINEVIEKRDEADYMNQGMTSALA